VFILAGGLGRYDDLGHVNRTAQPSAAALEPNAPTFVRLFDDSHEKYGLRQQRAHF
jgi:hypothetical protein